MSLYITGTRLILPISDFFDALIIPQQLQASGIDIHQAIAIFGEITGIAATIAYMPTIITSALSHILSPKNCGGLATKKKGTVSLAFPIGFRNRLFIWSRISFLRVFLCP